MTTDESLPNPPDPIDLPDPDVFGMWAEICAERGHPTLAGCHLAYDGVGLDSRHGLSLHELQQWADWAWRALDNLDLDLDSYFPGRSDERRPEDRRMMIEAVCDLKTAARLLDSAYDKFTYVFPT